MKNRMQNNPNNTNNLNFNITNNLRLYTLTSDLEVPSLNPTSGFVMVLKPPTVTIL